MGGLIAVVVVLGVIGILIYLVALLVFTLASPEGVAKMCGVIIVPLLMQESNNEVYVLRVYKLWGLIPSKYFVSRYTDYSNFKVCDDVTSSQVRFSASELIEMVDKLIPPINKIKLTPTSVEEMKMKQVMED